MKNEKEENGNSGKQKMDNFKVIYKILAALEKSMDCECFDLDRIRPDVLGVSLERRNRYLEMLSDAGYVKGVQIKQYADGETQILPDNIQITLKGLEYLAENSIMQRHC